MNGTARLSAADVALACREYCRKRGLLPLVGAEVRFSIQQETHGPMEHPGPHKLVGAVVEIDLDGVPAKQTGSSSR